MNPKRILPLLMAAFLVVGCTTNTPAVSGPVSQPLGGNVEWCVTPKDKTKTCTAIAYGPGITGESSLKQADGLNAEFEATIATSQYGAYIKAVNGYEPDATMFWEFLVNGKQSSVGISGYNVQVNDKLELKLTAIQ